MKDKTAGWPRRWTPAAGPVEVHLAVAAAVAVAATVAAAVAAVVLLNSE